MRYLSVCSGIEAASVAWHHLGWQPVGFSEIEPFPSAVLAHRFPNVPNYGDMTRHGEWPIEPGSIDLLVGGTPCQSFSVAGLRKGLSDPRGGLMLTYLEIAQRLRPRWIVWENVPGVLSSGSGRDLGAFLGALGELGYGWAYRVLDAQWVRTQRHPRAVPQRRRRVFVVGCFGDGAAAASVQFKRQSLQRDYSARPASRKGVASDAETGVARCVTTGEGKRQDWETCTIIPQPVAVDDASPTLTSRMQGSSGWAPYNETAHLIPVAFRKSRRAQSVHDHETWVAAEQANTLNSFDTGERDTHAVAFASNLGTRGGDVYDNGVSPTVRTGSSGTSGHPPAVAFHPTQDPISSSESSHALGTGSKGGCATAAVAFNDTAATLKGGSGSRGYPDASDGNGHSIVGGAMTVRRLTPRECERLQGFPDDWTMIPWRKKTAEDCPDGPRYKALGNSMAVNVMAWIGERIDNYERTGNALRTEG